MILIIIAVISIIVAIFLQPINSKFSIFIVGVSIFFILTYKYTIITDWLKFTPNEISVDINIDNLTISYPKPKDNLIIPFSKLKSVTYNKLSHNQEASIMFEQSDESLKKLGLDFDQANINSLTEKEWESAALKYGFSLTIAFELDSSTEKDIYLIEKELNSDNRIPKDELQTLIKNSKEIQYLGTQVYYNTKDKEHFEPMEQYSFETQHGVETFDIIQGKIVISYSKNQRPKELDQSL